MASSGRQRHIARLRRMSGPAFDRAIGAALFAGGNRIQVAAQIAITTGAVSGKGHVASLPGEAPNQDTAVLGNNIETVQLSPTVVEVSSNAPYSAPLEMGTSRMAARPFMAPARDRERPAVVRLVSQALAALARRP